ncbi:hypothetical protein [Bacillus thuringiensis]|uniref:hypothetical protein n=1 Tax=Bacillus thuringiensis TaxID=1428 RepID=UPI000BF4E9A4|nr:hypothetical protein [Bacillus thuringiensis]PEQ29739.1 hypothetical protein CN471_25090 [Bacillus thuringiensis]
MSEYNRPLSTLLIRDLMLEALAYEKTDLPVEKDLFNNYRYSGSQSDLFRITELLAIKHQLIEKKVNVPMQAWGATGRRLHTNSNTNFLPDEIEALYETFWLLLNQNIISPGTYGESESLPYFHITSHGLECIAEKEILPYDIDGYLERIRKIPNIDYWVKSYITEAVRCFNANCHHAATIMIGLTAEKLVIDLIDSFKTYLKNKLAILQPNGTLSITSSLDIEFSTKVDSDWKISHKYTTFQTFYDGIKNHDSDVKKCMEQSSRRVFYDYIRLIRNEVSHPNDLKKGPTETLLLLVSFTKYIEMITILTYTLRTV